MVWALSALLGLLGMHPKRYQRLARGAALSSYCLELGAFLSLPELRPRNHQRSAPDASLWSSGLACGAAPGSLDPHLWGRRQRLVHGALQTWCCLALSAFLGLLGLCPQRRHGLAFGALHQSPSVVYGSPGSFALRLCGGGDAWHVVSCWVRIVLHSVLCLVCFGCSLSGSNAWHGMPRCNEGLGTRCLAWVA